MGQNGQEIPSQRKGINNATRMNEIRIDTESRRRPKNLWTR